MCVAGGAGGSGGGRNARTRLTAILAHTNTHRADRKSVNDLVAFSIKLRKKALQGKVSCVSR